jgi:hypothetical protein
VTKRQALNIVIEQACEGARGAGQGIRQVASEDRRALLAVAVKKLWPDATGLSLKDYPVPWYLGLSDPEEAQEADGEVTEE